MIALYMQVTPSRVTLTSNLKKINGYHCLKNMPKWTSNLMTFGL